MQNQSLVQDKPSKRGPAFKMIKMCEIQHFEILKKRRKKKIKKNHPILSN